ncbi:GNAT family N-acetyltransferase [Ornithinimicrobium cavernae]|uniref:GNAT family N-acetyltransferase n=1 Tax=Ornithinimicrobium cavernae TaxID=2666047 RepID=UPI001F1936EC|nr:GNAT family N-acetyltransferase [Ornithinimicrobium cavernae]
MSHSHHHQPGPLADASVRTGRVSDAPAVGLVQATVWRDAFAGKVPQEVLDAFEGPAFASAWRRSLQDPPSPLHRLLVACAGEQVVGFAAIGPAEVTDETVSETDGEILVMGVHPQARRDGHGSRLLNAAADTLRAGDRTAVLTWLPADDEQARAFTDAAGLVPDGAWRERVVGPGGETVREVRVRAEL